LRSVKRKSERKQLRLKPELSLPARVEELWRIWAGKYSQAADCVTSAYTGPGSESVL